MLLDLSSILYTEHHEEGALKSCRRSQEQVFLCFRIHTGELAFGMGVCIRLRVLPFGLERYTSSNLAEEVVFPTTDTKQQFSLIPYATVFAGSHCLDTAVIVEV